MKSFSIGALILSFLTVITECAGAQTNSSETSSQVPEESTPLQLQISGKSVTASPLPSAEHRDGHSKPTKRSSLGKAPHEWGYFDVGGDVISPRSHQEYLTRAGGGGFTLGFRPVRYLQAGLSGGFLGNFNGNPDSTAPFICTSGCTGTYTATIKTHGRLLAMDGRAVLPLFRERLQISAGGGMAWLGISESADTGNVSVPQTCPPVCGDANGHGPTEVVEIKYFPGGGPVGFGFHVRAMQIKSSGLNFDSASLGGTYNDNFLLIGGQVSVRFGMPRR